MKEKKQKYLEDFFDEYVSLLDEQTEVPALIEKAQKKFNQHLSSNLEGVYKQSDAEDLYKSFSTIKKYRERENEINVEIAEVEETLKAFLLSLNGGKVSYEKKDDNDKSKITVLFSLEDDKIKCNR